MDSSTINAIIYCITILIIVISIGIFIKFIIGPKLDMIINIKNQDVKNKKYELFSRLDPKLLEQSVDDYLNTYINRYITYKFIANKVMYINQEEVEKMIKDITTVVNIQISELYIFYIKCITAISSDEDLLEYTHSKISNLVIEAVTSFNSAMQP